MQTVRLIYASKVSQTLTLDTVHQILRVAIPRNASKGITGFLCFDRSHFLQALEGDPDEVNELYHRIARDPRHQNLSIISYCEVERREFPDWTMGDFDLEGFNGPATVRHHLMGNFRPRRMNAPEALGLLRELNQIRLASSQPFGI